MRVRVLEIAPTKVVTLTGAEPWVKSIATSIQDSDSARAASITGEIRLRTDSAGFVYAKGTLKHTPLLGCGRCDKDIAWPIEADIDVSWRPPYGTHAPRDISLTSEDLDVYFIEEGTVDLEQLVLDTLLCALPAQLPPRRDDSDDCGICGISLAGGLVYGETAKDEPRESPFAILKQFKS